MWKHDLWPLKMAWGWSTGNSLLLQEASKEILLFCLITKQLGSHNYELTPDCFHFLLDRPKPMNYKGKDVRNVFHLRTPEDANSIARLANNKNAVIVGTSFVGEKRHVYEQQESELLKCYNTMNYQNSLPWQFCMCLKLYWSFKNFKCINSGCSTPNYSVVSVRVTFKSNSQTWWIIWINIQPETRIYLEFSPLLKKNLTSVIYFLFVWNVSYICGNSQQSNIQYL